MAGAVDLLLYGIAMQVPKSLYPRRIADSLCSFISPVAVYFKKGVGAQFWVNCCLYCLMGVPGIIHAFYIIHTTKTDNNSQQKPHAAPPNHFTPRQRTSSLPSLPHSDRYRPVASFSPYEGHPPPVPPKREEQLAYDPALHPNANSSPIGRSKAVLHTYQIPESTLHPPPLPKRARRQTPSPDPPIPEPQPQSQSEPETRASSSTLHPDPGALPYPAEYHPNSAGANIGRAKGVLHTYQIPGVTISPPEDPPAPEPDQALKRNKTTSAIMKGPMWSLRSKGKGLSPLDVNSPTAVPKPDSAGHRAKWATTGPSWLRRRRGREEPVNMVHSDGEAPSTMTMVWDDNFEALRPADRSLKQAKTHARGASEPVALPFPVPPGAVRPVVDRTGTSNTILLGHLKRRESGLEAVDEDTPIPESTISEGENATAGVSPTHGHADTDTEIGRSKSRMMSRLSRRQPRLRLVTAADIAPTPTASAPPKIETESPQSRTVSPSWPRHIAPPAILASSIDEPRPGLFRRARTSSEVASATTPPSATAIRNDIDFAMGEFGLGSSGDAYSAGSRALHSRSGSTATPRGLPSAGPGGKRLSTSTAFSQETAGSPLLRRGLTQGTFGTGMTKLSSSTNPTSEEGEPRPMTPRSRSQGDIPDTERSQDEQIDDWIRQEDERRESASRAATSLGHSESSGTPPPRGIAPDAASIFSEESSGFAGIGVGTAIEKGRTGKLEVWDQPNWNGSNPSAQSHSTRDGYPYAQEEEDPFKDPEPAQAPSTATHSSYATGQESLPPAGAPLSPPLSPERPTKPTRAPPAIPSSSSPTSSKPTPLRMATFGTAGESSMSFGLLSPSKESGSSSSPPAKTQAPAASPPASPPAPATFSKPSSSKPPPVPTRPYASPPRAKSPKLPPKPAILRSMSSEDDDLSEVYARALRDEI